MPFFVNQVGPRSIVNRIECGPTPFAHVKVAVVGCGAVGSFYGAKLARLGHEVHFLLRTDYEVVRRQGVWVRSGTGDFWVQPKCAREPEQIGVSDLVLIGLKTTGNLSLIHI